jgi:hypothetical protein
MTTGPGLVSADLSSLSEEDQKLVAEYILNGTKAASHTTKNNGKGLRLPQVGPDFYTAVHQGMSENMQRVENDDIGSKQL